MTDRSVTVSARVASVMASLAQRLRDRDLLYWKRARVVRCDALGGDEPPATPVDARVASEEDLHRLASMQGRSEGDWLSRRARGVMCLVAWSGPAPIGYLWITRSAELMTEVNHVLDVSRDPAGAYLFDGYVFPSHRRQGVLRGLLQSSKRWGAQRGLSRLYAAFTRDNHVSEHALHRAGFQAVVGDISLLRVLHREWKWIRIPHGTPVVGVLSPDGPGKTMPSPT
ncbi:MAG TPA: GNAT family N-acetyltransferase [Thermoplasmata archaeon]|nr:GNAT family N-acetyltransferase [Thermoplasmata archaeon]